MFISMGFLELGATLTHLVRGIVFASFLVCVGALASAAPGDTEGGQGAAGEP